RARLRATISESVTEPLFKEEKGSKGMFLLVKAVGVEMPLKIRLNFLFLLFIDLDSLWMGGLKE
ncbi:hypothetical protein Ancab_021197, partial [Ancistrocladus abbreviatus]